MNWIKTSEQLPPKGVPVLVATDDIRCPYDIWSYSGKTSVNDPMLDMWRVENDGGIMPESPLAWQPLPEPYNGN